MTLSEDTENALVQLLAQRINDNLRQATITHTNKDRNDATVSPAVWNARAGASRKQLRTAITCGASAAGSNLVIQIWLGYDVKPLAESTPPASIPFNEMLSGVDDTGSNGPYPEVFKSGTTPEVRYFAVEPGGTEPTYTNNSGQEPKYPVYDVDISPYPVNGAGAIVT